MSDTALSNLSSAQQIASNHEKYKDKFSDANEQLVNSQTFLNLLVSEMTNQDPLEPTSNTEFVTQMAQFTQLQYAKDSSTYSKSNYASSLVGKVVTASKMDGSKLVTKTGVVEKVTKDNDTYSLTIDGVVFELNNVTAIAPSDTTTDSTGSLSGSTLGQYITNASSMIGMNATINSTTSSGNVVDSGLITSVQVKNGQVNVIINNIAYPLTDIVEVRYPQIVSDDTTSGDKDDSTDTGAETPTDTAVKTAADTDDTLAEVTSHLAANAAVYEDIPDITEEEI